MLGCDSGGGQAIPSAYDGSWSIMPDGYDGSDYQPGFNGGDADGANWRQFLPLVVWPDKEWFDAEGNYIGKGGGKDLRKTTVTRQAGQIPQHYLRY
mmetsp:Transcript_48446/g.75654  ORF Transcript_48446/g.75654 Transcript_48446/m.75654 type:complete len:96 (-) Transcript_48446:141-428(-)